MMAEWHNYGQSSVCHAFFLASQHRPNMVHIDWFAPSVRIFTSPGPLLTFDVTLYWYFTRLVSYRLHFGNVNTFGPSTTSF